MANNHPPIWFGLVLHSIHFSFPSFWGLVWYPNHTQNTLTDVLVHDLAVVISLAKLYKPQNVMVASIPKQPNLCLWDFSSHNWVVLWFLGHLRFGCMNHWVMLLLQLPNPHYFKLPLNQKLTCKCDNLSYAACALITQVAEVKTNLLVNMIPEHTGVLKALGTFLGFLGKQHALLSIGDSVPDGSISLGGYKDS